MTFVRNHAKGMLACDFFVSVTVRFQILYVFVVMEVGSRASCISVSLPILGQPGPYSSFAKSWTTNRTITL
jgi:hypothetical protein